jgi:hypothetical protein
MEVVMLLNAMEHTADVNNAEAVIPVIVQILLA